MKVRVMVIGTENGKINLSIKRTVARRRIKPRSTTVRAVLGRPPAGTNAHA